MSKVPSKEDIESVYNETRNLRGAARHFAVDYYKFIKWMDEYGIQRLKPLDNRIKKNDLKKPSKEELQESMIARTLPETSKYWNVGDKVLRRWIKEYGMSPKTIGQIRGEKRTARLEKVKPNNLRELYKTHTIHELASMFQTDKSVIRRWLSEDEIKINKAISRGETRLFEYILSLDGSFIQNDKSVIYPLELDIVSHEHKLAFEYCGVYWHSSKFKDKHYHSRKREQCKTIGYELITIFETDNEDKIKALIKSKLGLNKRLYARNCEVGVISSKDAFEFHNAHHLHNGVKSKYNLALVYDNNIVMVISFTKSRYNKEGFECTRLTSHSDYSIIGGVSKLFKHSLDKWDFDEIVTYADLRFGAGNSYLKSGFEFSHTTGPNFWYHDAEHGILRSRIYYQKHKLKNLLNNFDERLTADQNLENAGKFKIYDCGSNVYKYPRSGI